MPKNQSSESETLDEKIKRIRKKNEEIEKRRLEVEADKQTAAKLNALVQLSAPKEDWPPPRPYICDDNTERTPVNAQENTRERNKGTAAFDNSLYEGKRPPPDPAYKFLADAERDPLPHKNSSRYQQISQDRRHGTSRGRGRGTKANIRDNTSLNERDSPGYEAWRAERNRIDEERIRRQRTPQGQWRREWDNQKLEDDWQASANESRREQNSTQNRLSSSNELSESSPRKFVSRITNFEEGTKRDIAKKPGRNMNEKSSDSVEEPLQKNVAPSNRSSDEEKKSEITSRSSAQKTASLLGQPLQPALAWNDSRCVANSGNTLHVSFVNDPSVQKAVPPPANRRRLAGSGRLGVPPAAPRRGDGLTSPACAEGGDVGEARALPQRRIREARRRRRTPAAPRKSSTGDDSWEDADDHSEGEKDANSGLLSAQVDVVKLAGEPFKGEGSTYSGKVTPQDGTDNPAFHAGEGDGIQLGELLQNDVIESMKSESSEKENTESESLLLLAHSSETPDLENSDLRPFKKTVEVNIGNEEDRGGATEEYAQENTERGVYLSSSFSEVLDSKCEIISHEASCKENSLVLEKKDLELLNCKGSFATVNTGVGCREEAQTIDKTVTEEIITLNTCTEVTTTLENKVTSSVEHSEENLNCTVVTTKLTDRKTQEYQSSEDDVFVDISEKENLTDNLEHRNTASVKTSAHLNTYCRPAEQSCNNSEVIYTDETKPEYAPDSEPNENSKEEIDSLKISEAGENKLTLKHVTKESDSKIQTSSISNKSDSFILPETKENSSVPIDEQDSETQDPTSETPVKCQENKVEEIK